jgi:pimeloyl-ACP methyl ester carboxylesterase
MMCGWLYSSDHFTSLNPGPAIVLAHGLGGTKELKLDVYADKFNQLGYTCVVFDYRCNGGSRGLPRALIDWSKQQEDWKSAIEFTRRLENVDTNQVGLFGTSFSGGHVIELAARGANIKAVISQCPFTDGWKSSLRTGISKMPKMTALGLMDSLFGSDHNPVTVSLTGKPGDGNTFPFFAFFHTLIYDTAALMSAPDVLTDFTQLIPPGHQIQERVPARLILKMPLLRPGSYTSDIQCPILFAICGKDSVAPADATLEYAKKAPKGVVKWYEDIGHFEIYYGDAYQKAMQDYVSFLQEYLPI